MTDRAFTKSGRRATVLLWLGLIAVLQAVVPDLDNPSGVDGAWVVDTPTWVIRVSWAVAAVLALAGAAWPTGMRGDRARTIGFAALAAVYGLKAGTWLISVIVGWWPGEPAGHPQAAGWALMWTLLLATLMTVSGWHDPWGER